MASKQRGKRAAHRTRGEPHTAQKPHKNQVKYKEMSGMTRNVTIESSTHLSPHLHQKQPFRALLRYTRTSTPLEHSTSPLDDTTDATRRTHELALCNRCHTAWASGAHVWVPAGHPRYTRAPYVEEAVGGAFPIWNWCCNFLLVAAEVVLTLYLCSLSLCFINSCSISSFFFIITCLSSCKNASSSHSPL